MQTPFFFDDDLFDFGDSRQEDEGGAGAEADDLEDSVATLSEDHGGSGAASNRGSESGQAGSGRRKRGSRGGSQASGGGVDAKRWRSGAIPAPPTFDGNVEADPFCFRHYRRRLLRWTRLTREFLPPGEQALRALERLEGEAELEFEEIEDSRFDKKDGVEILLRDLEAAFGEKELFRQGGTIREFESIGRLQGESVTAFVRRFRLLERKLADNKVPPYPEQARVVKLLDGLRLDEKSTASLLLAAGNRYDMRAIQEAIRVQYPAGMSITGLPRGRPDLRRGRGRGRSASSRTPSTSTSAGSGRWRQWNTSWDDEGPDHEWEVSLDNGQEPSGLETVPEQGEATLDFEDHDDDDEDMFDYVETGDRDQNVEENYPDADEDTNWAGNEDISALIEAAREPEVGKAGSKGKTGKGGKSKGKGKSSGRGMNAGKAKGKGKQSAGGKGKSENSAVQQQRLKGSLCLGCGSADHWLKDCPSYNTARAQLTSASYEGLVLNAEGTSGTWGAESSWMVSSDLEARDENGEEPPRFELPDLSEFMVAQAKMFKTPTILLQTCEGASSAYMIADTGCQRQVAGAEWHVQKAHEIEPLSRIEFPDKCKFFGPTAAAFPSLGRHAYPAAIAGIPLVMCISEVSAKAPGLMSRRVFEALGAVPDVHTGEIYFRAFDRVSRLWLSPCGHLAIRVDEWPEHEFTWPPKVLDHHLPDVAHPAALADQRSLAAIDRPAQPVPHASSAMAVAMARLPEATPELRVLREPDRDPVLNGDIEACTQGRDPPHLRGSLDGDNPSHDGGSSGCKVGAGDEQVCEGPAEVQPQLGSPSLWRSWCPSPDVRSLWRSLRSDAIGNHDPRHAESSPLREDTFEPAGSGDGADPRWNQAEGRQGKRLRRHQRNASCAAQSTGSVPKLLASLLHLLAGICSIQGGGPQGET